MMKSLEKTEVLCVSSTDASFLTFLPLTSPPLFLCQTHMHTCSGMQTCGVRARGQNPASWR